MECPMCYEQYNQERTARNLLCGHTYCQVCLEKVFELKRRIECPMCRHKHDPSLKVISLSRNYVAMELASKHQEVIKKLQMCSVHSKNPLQFFCEDCQLHLCTDCIVEHSGHKFCKQEHSVFLLKERLAVIQEKLKVQMTQQEKLTFDFDASKAKLNIDYQQQVKVLDNEFDILQQRIEERRKQLRDQIDKVYDEEIKFVHSDYKTNQSLHEDMMSLYDKMNGTHEQLSQLICKHILDSIKVLKNDQMIQIVDNLEEEAEKDFKQQFQLKVNDRKTHRLTFDQSLQNDITKYGTVDSSEQENMITFQHPKLCFFGNKHKILLYDLEKETWSYRQIKITYPQNLEFNYYSASTTLPNGEIIITGGGISKNVILVMPQKNYLCQNLKNMFFPRKEHAAVYLNGFVYAIGGYDGSQKQMLSSCERYSLEAQEWTIIEPLQKAKCAFAASAVNNEFIFVFGGFDGRERLNTIERFSCKDNKWITIDTKFKNGFSNAASVSDSKGRILILGGGSNQGFTLDLQLFDMASNSLKTLTKMSEGRDLRNKLCYLNGFLYSCGGNNCSAEKYSVSTNKWSPLKNYNNFVSDNLDSWCCSLTYDAPENLKASVFMQQISNRANNYQIYEYFSSGLSEEMNDDEEFPEYDQEAYDGNGINFDENQRGRVFQI